MPRLLGICGVKNEQDIIEPFVRHNLNCLDYLLVLDNGSVDNTKPVLKNLAGDFANLIVFDDDSFGNPQSARMTQLLRTGVSTYQPDYVIPLDADEFLPVTDKATLVELLQCIPPGGYGLMPWRTYVLTPDTVSTACIDPPRTFQWRRREELPVFSKIVLRTDGPDRSDFVIEHGCHSARSLSGREVPSVPLDSLGLLHFPVRSRDQFIGRIVVGWMANLARDPKARSSGLAWQKRDNFDRIAHGDQIDERTLCECSLLYAQDSRPIDWQADVVSETPQINYVRRYSTGRAMSAIQLIARSWGQSLQIERGIEEDVWVPQLAEVTVLANSQIDS